MKLTLILISLACILTSLTNYSYGSKSINTLKRAVKEFSDDHSLRNATWGFSVYNIDTGEELISVNPDISLIPASNMKIVTTGCALNLLGKDFRYETKLQYSGHIDDNGILQGNIYIKGSGDPTFGSSFIDYVKSIDEIFDDWVDEIKRSGIKEVNGKIIADESIFDFEMVPREWTWEDIGNHYGAGSSGLTINENSFTVYFEPGVTAGTTAEVIETEPDLPWVDFINLVKTAQPNTGDRVYILGSPFSNKRWLTGTVPRGSAKFGVRGSMPDPAYFGAHNLHNRLLSNEIEVKKSPTTSRILQESNMFNLEERNNITSHFSPSLDSIIKRINTNSINTYAENLLKTIAYEKQNAGTLNAGIEEIKQFWSSQGIDIQGLDMHDGSGLAQKNRVTPDQLVQMLLFMDNSPLSEPFKESIAIAGKTGTLSHLFNRMVSRDILIAKTGFLSNVIAYSGYTKTSSNENLAFVLIVNDYDGNTFAMRNKMINLLDQITQIE